MTVSKTAKLTFRSRSAWDKYGLGKVVAALLVACFGTAQAAPTPTDYARSLGLRDAWVGMTRDIAFPASWRSDGRFYYRKTVEGGFTFVLGDPATGKSEPAFDARRLAESLSKTIGRTYGPLSLPFERFEYMEKDGDPNGALRVYIDYMPWHCSLSDYACAPEKDKKRPWGFGVVRDLRVPADNTPRQSQDKQWEAFAEGYDVILRRTSDGHVTRLTSDGRADAFYDPESIAWAPDSLHFAIYRVKPGYPRLVTRVESSPSDQLQPRVQEQLYPKAGDAVDIERPVLFGIDGSRRDIDDALFSNPYSMSPIKWRKDGGSFSFEYVKRGFQLIRILSVDASTAKVHAAVEDSSRTFVNTWNMFAHDVGDLGKEVVWTSERDGWRHLYVFDGVSGRARQITHGKWVVRKVVHVDDTQRRIWFLASGMDAAHDPYERQLFAVNFDGSSLLRLTKPGADHEVAVSDDGKWYVDVYSRPDMAPVAELRHSNGVLERVLETGDISRLVAAGWKPPETFVAAGRDGRTPIWGMIVRPRNYDSSKKYPVIENVYAGPHDSFVPKSFWPFDYRTGADSPVGLQALADFGFIVVIVDGMGTSNRSKAFHDVAWKNLGDSGFPDHIAWHKALAAKDPSYDLGRVGIYGMSAGGQSALGALERHPDFYKAGVAMVGCYDNRMDKISWNEQWMGWPVDESYARASGVVNAGKLRGDLLLIVGEQDTNVDPASTAQVVDALIKAGKDFELLNVPGAGHALGRSTEPVAYVKRRTYGFLIRSLLGEPAPHWNSISQ